MKIIFSLLLLLSSVAFAQIEAEDKAFHVYDTKYEVIPYLQIANFSFYAGAPDIRGKAYVPNFATSAGLGLGWKDYRFATGISLPIPKEEMDRRGKSDQVSLILSKYWRRSAIDLYYQRYRGFYAGDPASEFNLSKPERFTQFPDAMASNYGFNYYYALSENKYSFKSAFANKEDQIDSGGSAIVHAFYNHVQMSLGNTIIPGTEPNDIQLMPVLQEVSLDTLGAGYGYGYTFIVESFSATAQAIAGIGMQTKSGITHAALKGNCNLSLSLRLERGSVGLRFLMDTLYSKPEQEQIYSTFMVGTLFYQYRF